MPTIRELREKACLSQEELAAAAGVSVFTISRLERSHHKPQPKNLRNIAKALGVKPGEIEFRFPDGE